MEQIYLNIIPTGQRPICHVSQNDNDRRVRVHLLENSLAYTIKEGDSVSIHIRKPNGDTVSADVESVEGETYVDVIVTDDMCNQDGKNLCEIRIVNDGTRLGTLNFYMCVELDPAYVPTPPTPSIPIIDCLCSDGRQRITLPIHTNDGCVLKFKMKALAAWGGGVFIGDIWDYGGIVFYQANTGLFEFRYAPNGIANPVPYVANKWMVVELDYNTGILKLDGIEYGGNSGEKSSNSIALFDALGGYHASAMAIGEISVYQNGEETYHFVPMEDETTGAGYLYDTINEQSYYSDSGYSPLVYTKSYDDSNAAPKDFLFLPSDLIPNTYISTNAGQEGYSSYYSATDYIEVFGDELLNAYSGTRLDLNAWYDENKTYISMFSVNSGSSKITVPSNAKYARWSGENGQISQVRIWREAEAS